MEKQNSEFLPDILKIYFGGDIEVANGITIHQPTMGDIVEYGEARFWGIIHQFCGNTTSMRVMLWELGINWNKITDWELFRMFAVMGVFKPEDTNLFLIDLDLSNFEIIEIPPEPKEEEQQPEEEPDSKAKTEEEKPDYILINRDDPTIQIDEEIYNKLMGYLRVMFSFHPKREFTKSKLTAESIIEEERLNARAQARVNEQKGIKPKWQPTILFPLMSAVINHPGTCLKKQELLDMPVFEFFDTLKRLQIYEQSIQLGLGRFMMVDTSSIDLNKELNWARDAYEN